MTLSQRRFVPRATSAVILAVASAFLASCAAPQPKAMVRVKKTETRSKEYFAESAYGVKASPRVTNQRSRLPRGGGRDQTGKPYKVAGKWYYPKEEKNYRKMGAASWYGDAFHGRLTANGEIYDMTHLTAAHPTMPLPSYARVTNTKNGNSVIVRVNDRGPYAHDRVIDLSRRAAELLDYTHAGTAKVEVEYVGRAPLDGRDEQFLMASYNPGNRATDPSVGMPTGVMIAMNGPTPSLGVSGEPQARAFPGTLSDQAPVPAFAPANAANDIGLPSLGPVAPERPVETLGAPPQQLALATMSYADEGVGRAASAFSAFASPPENTDWKKRASVAVSFEPYVAAGTFANQSEALAIQRFLVGQARVTIEKSREGGADWFTVSVYPDGHLGLDALLQTAWAHGAPDAIVVRD
ncbi:septal ring lytic transglycosylase RlpA family protein [Mesorhizobium sp. NBSH29]|uniref:septal ring lytic transglycosylase RlpA family protein n=1 Tax=Mesorhizobium sp. NBSH29 TaxID=2654249 RepID=UPI001896572A|nr:septal ring lytic transglycosylase RlpA family protein [Mesorhizobium sp. NBSH29]QPC87733.1 septal ring lytic transglycosylase RlpA family protein [Mesorhizobium sp. NBSH29]